MKEKTNIFKNLFWILGSIFKFDKRYIFVLGFSIIIAGAVPPITTLISQEIVNKIQIEAKWETILLFVIVYVSIDLIGSIITYIMNYYMQKVLLSYNLYFSEMILKKAEKLSLKSYEDSETYDKITMAQYQGNGKILSYLETFSGIISSAISLISFSAILLSFQAWIVICIMVIPVIKFIISRKLNIMSFKLIKNRMNDTRKSSYIQYLLTHGDFNKELKTYNLFDYFIEIYKKYIKEFNRQDIDLEKKRSLWLSCVSIVENVIDGSLFAYIAYLGLTRVILIGNVMTYMRTVSQIKEQMVVILETFSTLNKESLFIDQLIVFFNLPELDNTQKAKSGAIKQIEVRNLWYRYSGKTEYALKNINLKINSNEIIAIVGQNGSGKTTLIKILMGFYEDYEGEIFVNGINLKEIDKQHYLTQIATLFQDFVKYEATFRENVAYGNLQIKDNDSKLYEIIKLFGLEKLVADEARGLDTQIGFWFDNGKQISLGQWQKVALSRAFAKEASMYILDEPNAALDPISEYNLAQLYFKLIRGNIGIIVAHKFNNFCKQVDKIIVMKDGKIESEGMHEELIENSHLYKQLYEIQSGTIDS